MHRHLLTLLMLAVAGMCQAQSLPPALQALQNQLDENTAKLDILKEKINKLSKQNSTQAKGLQHSTMALVQLANQPPAVVLMHSLANPAPHASGAASVLAASRRQLWQGMQHTGSQLAKIGPLYTQSQQHTLALKTLAAQTTRGKKALNLQQRVALNAAALQAANLAQNINQALAPTDYSPQLQPLALPQMPTATYLPVSGKIIKDFNPEKDQQGWTFNTTSGTTVISISAGEVMYSGPFRHYGGMVIISPAPHKHVVYTGLASLHVSAGNTVIAGQMLGQMPATTSPRLYVEYRHKGQPRSPARLYE